MARPERNTVDYFPHLISDGKKMFFIEQKYGNDGYCVWFKVLETLAATEYHYIDLNNESDIMYLSAKCRVSEEILRSIITDLAKFGEIDKILWQSNVIWCPKFIDSIEDAYSRRNNNCMTLDGLRIHLLGLGVLKYTDKPVKGSKKPQSKVKETKEKEIRIKQVAEICNFSWHLFPKSVRPDNNNRLQLKTWSDTIDKLIRIDGKDPTEIKEVITWAREDDWWKLKFLSIVKLRKNNPDGIKYYDYFNENRKNGKQRTKIDTKTIPKFDPDSYSGFRGSDTSDKSSDQGGK